MAALQFLLDSDSAGGLNKFLLSSDDPSLIAIAASAQQSQQSSAELIQLAAAISATAQQIQQVAASLTNWSYVTLAAPINTGPGSVANLASFTGTPPKPGDIIAYDGTILLIATDGSMSWSGYGSAQAQYNDGTTWYPFLVTVSPWGAEASQSQQASASVFAAPSIAASAQQGQQSFANVSQLGTVAASVQQSQQAQVSIRVTAKISATAQQGQSASAVIAAQPKVASAATQPQQAAAQIVAAPAISASAQQGQQSSANVAAQTRADIVASAQQSQQSIASITTTSVISAAAAHPQQASANVLVPQPVPIAAIAQQGQQATADIRVAAVLSVVAAQPMQSSASVAAFPRFAAEAQQGQQASATIPNLPSPPIAASAAQSQQATATLLSFPSISAAAQQSQQSSANVAPLPGQLGDIDPEGITIGSATFIIDLTPDTKTIYLGRDNAAMINVFYNGVLLNLTAVTRIEIGLIGTDTVIDSDTSPELIDWTSLPGVIKFKLGMEGVAPGLYEVAIVLFDIAHDDGQQITGSAGPVLKFDFVQDMAA